MIQINANVPICKLEANAVQVPFLHGLNCSIEVGPGVPIVGLCTIAVFRIARLFGYMAILARDLFEAYPLRERPQLLRDVVIFC